MNPVEEVLSEAESKVTNLKALLNQEFDYIKNDNLDQLTSLQEEKNKTLNELSKLKDIGEDQFGNSQENLPENIKRWDVIISSIVECKTLHQRNETFISRRLDSIRAALSILKSGNVENSLNLYDKRGAVSKRPT
ncbi:MAG: flagellar export chaperone FlgN [Pseudomonadota bacterium]|nr:flagellar export chaperone FlgN [Pseudomonadota bacterium]